MTTWQMAIHTWLHTVRTFVNTTEYLGIPSFKDFKIFFISFQHSPICSCWFWFKNCLATSWPLRFSLEEAFCRMFFLAAVVVLTEMKNHFPTVVYFSYINRIQPFYKQVNDINNSFSVHNFRHFLYEPCEIISWCPTSSRFYILHAIYMDFWISVLSVLSIFVTMGTF